MRHVTSAVSAVVLLISSLSWAAASEPANDEQKTLYALGVAISQSLTPFTLNEAELEFVKSGIADGVKFALIEAEEYGITQANVDQLAKSSTDPVVGRILGTTEDTGKLLGLDKSWAANAIKAVGNYGEIFERNVGPKSALKLPRGANNLWNKGGLLYAPPVR